MIVDMYTINLKKIGLNQFFFSFFLFLYVQSRSSQPINHFISLADKLFSPITTHWWQNNQTHFLVGFSLKPLQRIGITSIMDMLSLTPTPFNTCFHMTILPFSGGQFLPLKTDLQSGWENKLKFHKFMKYADTIKKDLMKLGKYYSKSNDKPVYILVLSKLLDADCMMGLIVSSALPSLQACIY